MSDVNPPFPSSPPEADPPPTGYREVTVAALVFGILVGLVLNAAITYSGLKIGFTLGGSAVAAVLGWGVLRGILGKGTIVENNIAQTVASSVNTSNSGVIFTVPVLFLLGISMDGLWPWLAAACAAGAILGVAFIIPTRKQMVELDRLRFPTGTAVATVLRSPGEGSAKSIVLLFGILVSGALTLVVDWPDLVEKVPGILATFPGLPSEGLSAIGIPILGDSTVNLSAPLAAAFGDFWLPELNVTLALAPFAIGAGFITGRPGLVVLAGGVLAYWVITPIAFRNDWTAAGLEFGDVGEWVRGNMNRPIGIGMLLGGALVGLLFALPAMRGAFSSIGRSQGKSRVREEMPLWVLWLAIPAAFGVLYFAAQSTITGGDPMQAVKIAALGTAWMWFAGIVIAQCTGMTDWSPISGIALVTVLLCMFMTDMQVIPAVLVGSAVCVAMTLCADMMQDLKTGHLVGSRPARQQIVELCVVWIGPLVSLAVVWLLAKQNLQSVGVAFGPGTDVEAPQAAALEAAINSVRGGDAAVHLYGMGAILGVLLSFSGLAGLGVLVGLSMYLPLVYLLPYGLGCLLQMFCKASFGGAWTERWGVPFAAGLLVGEGLIGVTLTAVKLLAGGGA
ncbi:MAG: OPT/YSL family transporter [Planctomycetota bacterium]